MSLFPKGINCGATVQRVVAVTEEAYALMDVPWVEKKPGSWERKVLIGGLEISEYLTVCIDCGVAYATRFVPTEAVLAEADVESCDIPLCIPCFEKRLGRALELRDLDEGPGMNALAFHVYPGGEHQITEDPVAKFNREFTARRQQDALIEAVRACPKCSKESNFN